MDLIVDILFFILSVWFAIWMINHVNKMTSESKDGVEEEDINLFMEKVEQNGQTTLLAWREGNNTFVCQAPTEKELHTKLFEIFKGKPINLRVGEDTMLKITFEVFEKPVNQ